MIKKIFTTLFTGILTLGLSAQTEQGAFLIGGTTLIDYSSATLDADDIDNDLPTSLYSPDPNFEQTVSEREVTIYGGFFIIDGLLLGAGISYEYEKTEWKRTNFDYGYSTSSTYKSAQEISSYMIGPLVRYYISDFFLQSAYYIGKAKQKNSDERNNINLYNPPDLNINQFKVGAGYAIWISSGVALTPTINYEMITRKGENTIYTYDFNGIYNETSYEWKEKHRGYSIGLGINIHI